MRPPPTATHGHFGRTPGKTAAGHETFTWEKTDKAEALKKACGAPGAAGAKKHPVMA